MKTRIFRVLVCFVVLCALLISISPIRAKAAFATATTVYVAGTLVIGAAMIALGAQPGVDSAAWSQKLDEMQIVMNAVGGYLQNGCVEVFRLIDDAGQAVYYASAEFLESVRCAMFDTGVVYQQAESFTAGDVVSLGNGNVLTVQQDCYRVTFVGTTAGKHTLYEYVFSAPGQNLTYYLNGSDTLIQGDRLSAPDTAVYRVYMSSRSIEHASLSSYPSIGTYLVDYEENTSWRIARCFENGLLGVAAAEGLKTGVIPAVPIDGTSALNWSEEYGSRQLRLLTPKGDGDSGGDSGDDPQGGFVENVLFPLTLLGSVLDTAGLTQQNQWLGDTPSNVPDAEVVTEYEILDTPQIDGFQGVQVSPVTNPDLGTNPDPGDDPGSGSSPSGYTLDLTEYFPFCLPFDIYEFLSLLAAEPEAPVFEWVIPVPQMDTEFPISIDLSAWDGVAKLFRTFELLAFIIGLAMVTRDKFIRG